MSYIVKTTHQLKQGDVVVCHGLRCLIDGPMLESQCHPITDASPTLYLSAKVIERQGDSVPLGWLKTDASGRLNDGSELRWSIQGNGNALWYVEA